MDEFENNRENEHVDQTPHAETPYDTGDGNTDNLKRTEQQTEQNAEHRQEDAYTQAQQYGSTYYGDMRTQEYAGDGRTCPADEPGYRALL